MPTISEVLITIRAYSEKYRHPDRPLLEVSEKYDLFPSKNIDDGSCIGWPSRYPYADRAGVYLICDKDERVLYVGKASLTSTLGARLGHYFRYAPDGVSCCLNKEHEWSKVPRYLVTVAVPCDMAFEAPALEEFLITKYENDLPNNTLGAM